MSIRDLQNEKEIFQMKDSGCFPKVPRLSRGVLTFWDFLQGSDRVNGRYFAASAIGR